MTIPDERLAEIAEGCVGVSPGPWIVRVSPRDEDQFFVQAPQQNPNFPYGVELLGEDTGGFYPLETKRRDAAHIARLDPETVLALVTELKSSRAEIAALREGI